MTPRIRRIARTAIGLAAVAGVVVGCAGSVGGNTASEGSGEGFEYGAPQDEVAEAIADLEPVTLTFQPGASSQASPTAANALAFTKAVEKRSGGKISFNIAWGQSIAGYPEVEDALADGRIDIAYTAPIYFPDEHPMVDAYSKLTHYSESSPLVGEAVSAAMMSELGWNSEELLAEYTDKGLVPLSPLMSAGDYYTACSEPGTSLADWDGRQMRIASSAHAAIAESIGSTGVSMEYGETFEALERGTVDCTFVQPQVAGSTGIMEAAPYLGHFNGSRMTGSATGAHLAGSGFEALPLAYQQIIFDAQIDQFHGNLVSTMDAARQMVVDTNSAGGSIDGFDPAAEERIQQTEEGLVDDLIDEGRLDDDIKDQMAELADKWTGIVDELGYKDGGSLEDLDQWYQPGSVDFRPLSKRLFEDAALPHRPE
ncbi:TRAP transporter substrate-binding protein DctP [Nocardioides insulae]|uniref:TRAP transporter substrate-binding protein DctP n=1 Tax=Nocardioides insulae TaxID=394734 RepID=UPI00146E44AD|nr:TRAP transporter substrate-binding protein DctP [Nocardioides insulae]